MITMLMIQVVAQRLAALAESAVGGQRCGRHGCQLGCQMAARARAALDRSRLTARRRARGRPPALITCCSSAHHRTTNLSGGATCKGRESEYVVCRSNNGE